MLCYFIENYAFSIVNYLWFGLFIYSGWGVNSYPRQCLLSPLFALLHQTGADEGGGASQGSGGIGLAGLSVFRPSSSPVTVAFAGMNFPSPLYSRISVAIIISLITCNVSSSQLNNYYY